MWAKSPMRVSTKPKPKPPPPLFSCSSFKDIHLLLSEDQQQLPHHHTKSPSPRSPSIFHRVRLVNSLLRTWSARSLPPPPPITLPGTEGRVVIYFTSLRVVRSTFDDCRTVRSILRSFPVFLDERDVTMDHAYMDDLRRLFGGPTTAKSSSSSSKVDIPRVFIDGKYIGGAEEIKCLHESGELKKMLEKLPAVAVGPCGCCGGYRFVLCEDCNGSRKCYSEKGGGFRTCGACNENGLVRCPSCS